VLRPQLFTRARDWPRLVSARPSGEGVPSKKFNRENLKFGLKFSMCAPITSGLMGIFSRNFPGDVSKDRGDNVNQRGSNFWKARLLTFGRAKKTSKIRRDFRQLSTLIATNSGTGQSERNMINRDSSHVLQKVWWSTNKVILANIDPPKWTFRGDYISALRGVALSIF